MGLQVVRSDERAPRKMLAAVYSRISTVGHGQDSTMQTRELIEYCERRGWEVYGLRALPQPSRFVSLQKASLTLFRPASNVLAQQLKFRSSTQ